VRDGGADSGSPRGACDAGDGLEDGAAGERSGDLQRGRLAADGKERIRELQSKIGELTMENSFLEGALGKFPGPSGRR
jgi:hypothetical protein